MLREIESKLGFADMIVSCQHDIRDPSRTIHDYAYMIRARILVVCCGYVDCDELDILSHDPALKLASEKLPLAKMGIASQPILSPLENVPSKGELIRMGLKLIDLFCDSFHSVPKRITLDIDDAVDRTYSGQQLSLFNTDAGGYCFQSIHIYDAAIGKPFCFVLRESKRASGEEAALSCAM